MFFFKHSQNVFSHNFPHCLLHAYFLFLNEVIVDMEKSDGICSPAFVVDDFLELCLHVSILLRKDFRST